MKRPDAQTVPRDLSGGLRPRLAGVLGAGLVRVLGSTWRIDWLDQNGALARPSWDAPAVYAFWHGTLLVLSYSHRARGIVVLVSRHADGEYISQIICRLGFGVVRGSSTRGGLRALLEMGRAGREGHPLGVTPDGPRGPRAVLQAGVLHIAQRSGLPIVPLAASAVRRTRLASWDRFLIPHPWSRVAIVTGAPIHIPADLEPSMLEPQWGAQVRAGIEACEEVASAWRAERAGST